jgi:hypothetical protein
MGNNSPRKRTSSFSPVGGAPSAPKNVAYVVWEGRTLGVFEKWREVLEATQHYRGAVYAGFTDYDKAVEVWEEFESTGVIPTWNAIRAMKTPTKTAKAHKKDLDKTLRARATRNTQMYPGHKTTTCTAVDCTFPFCMC